MSLKTGKFYGNAKLDLDASLSKNSTMSIEVGDAYDMSVIQIKLIERNKESIQDEIATLQRLIAQLTQTTAKTPSTEVLTQKVNVFVEAAKTIVAKRKWYSISAEGLLEATKAVGSAASPLFDSATKLIGLLKQAHI